MRGNRWKGGKTISTHGYILVWLPEHPRASKQGYVFEHILVAEKALGRPIPKGAVVHHVDEDKTNNVSSNLVICESEAYHQELHARKRALEATGDPNSRHCVFCHAWDSLTNMTQRKGRGYYHRVCNAAYEYARRHKKEPISVSELAEAA